MNPLLSGGQPRHIVSGRSIRIGFQLSAKGYQDQISRRLRRKSSSSRWICSWGNSDTSSTSTSTTVARATRLQELHRIKRSTCSSITLQPRQGHWSLRYMSSTGLMTDSFTLNIRPRILWVVVSLQVVEYSNYGDEGAYRMLYVSKQATDILIRRNIYEKNHTRTWCKYFFFIIFSSLWCINASTVRLWSTLDCILSCIL